MGTAMRRTIIPLVLAVAGGALASCGGGSHTTSSSRSTAGTPQPGAPTGKVPTKPQALAFARAVNLTAADMPGFSASSTHERKTPRERRLERQALACAGSVASEKKIAEASSREFELKRGILDLGVSSEVSVARTSTIAARGLSALRGAHVRDCFSHYLDLLFKEQRSAGATAGPVSIQSGTPPAPGTTGGFGWRVTATFTVRHITVHLYMDLLGFVYGPAQVTLFSSGVLRPFPATVQQRLFALLLRRAKALHL
jgi:hypothetical protein